MHWRCPICHAPTDSETGSHFPFCSERCRMSDLGAWASGKYVISEPATDLDDSPEFLAQGDDEDER